MPTDEIRSLRAAMAQAAERCPLPDRFEALTADAIRDTETGRVVEVPLFALGEVRKSLFMLFGDQDDVERYSRSERRAALAARIRAHADDATEDGLDAAAKMLEAALAQDGLAAAADIVEQSASVLAGPLSICADCGGQRGEKHARGCDYGPGEITAKVCFETADTAMSARRLADDMRAEAERG